MIGWKAGYVFSRGYLAFYFTAIPIWLQSIKNKQGALGFRCPKRQQCKKIIISVSQIKSEFFIVPFPSIYAIGLGDLVLTFLCLTTKQNHQQNHQYHQTHTNGTDLSIKMAI